MKKKKIIEVTVYGKICPVYMVEGLTSLAGNYGEFIADPFEIRIDADVSLPMFIHTLGHEIIHATICRLHIQLPEGVEEGLCEQLMQPILEEMVVSLKTKHVQSYLKFTKNR